MKKKQVSLKYGFRIGFEETVNSILVKSNKKFSYESEKITYIQPESKHTYTPDFILNKPSGEKMYVETKGRWVKADRLKFDWVFDQHPNIDIRFVFQNPNAKLYKGGKTSYAQYCDKKSWLWAKKEIPKSWLDECL